MRSRIGSTVAAIVLSLVALSACGPGDANPVETTAVASTVQSSSTSSSSSSSATPTMSSAPTTSQETAAAATVGAECGVVGFTAAPGQESPHCLDKQISSCGSSIHQFGTTFFTDGTSGWTQTCDAQMRANHVPQTHQPPAPETFDQDAYNEQLAEEYWRNHPQPTFDPESADGYGPDQALPPACLRFEEVDC